ncbi:MAG: hypothetical protein QGH60_10650 [Phycisphaerae bacterium]|jgi:hypothetical protein|nr:hypothetical protein [Phycisphaerae bacterium]
MLTHDSQDAAVINIFELYPPVACYCGIYFDPKRLCFGISPFAGGLSDPANLEKTGLLTKTLNAAFSRYVSLLNLKPDEDPLSQIDTKIESLLAKIHENQRESGEIVLEDIRGEMVLYRSLKEFFEGLKRAGPVNVSVTKDLPTNSLLSGNQIMFDHDLIEVLLDVIAPLLDRAGSSSSMDQTYCQAPLTILAERIFHELGHLGFSGRHMSAETEEVLQIERDVIIYEWLISRNEQHKEAIEEFTNRSMTLQEDDNRKFSSLFQTAELFRNIQKWARRYNFHDRDETVDLIEQFVQFRLRRVYTIPNSTRLFPNPNIFADFRVHH